MKDEAEIVEEIKKLHLGIVDSTVKQMASQDISELSQILTI